MGALSTRGGQLAVAAAAVLVIIIGLAAAGAFNGCKSGAVKSGRPSAAVSGSPYGGVAYATAKVLAQSVGARPADSWGEIHAREFITGAFQQYGYFPLLQEFIATSGGGRIHSGNIIAVKEGDSAKRLVVGAHYDSAAVGEGYTDNATGIGLLLEVAARIKKVSTPYTVVFVAFGAGEDGQLGSQYYLDTLSKVDRRATIGMIDLDAPAGGDELSVVSRVGGATWLRDDALAAADELGVKLVTSPKAPGAAGRHGRRPVRRHPVRGARHRHGRVQRCELAREQGPQARPDRRRAVHVGYSAGQRRLRRQEVPGEGQGPAARHVPPPRDPAHKQTGKALLKLGIVGLPNVGKTTLFNALTHAQAAATAYAFTSAESNLGVVAVPDPRLDRLDEVLETPRKVNATIDLVDIAGLAEGASRGEGLGNRFLSDIRSVDAVAHVVRVFENPEVAHVRDTHDPRADVDLVETELVLSDVELVERRLDKTRKTARSGDKSAKHELEVLEALNAELLEGKLAKRIERTADDEALFRELALVSDRPVLFVLNTDDDQSAAAALEQHADFVEWARGRGDQVVAVAARLEAELADLDPEEAAEFRAELGADEAGTLDVVLRACYEVLGYITFFTGDFRSSESRAWQLPRGWTAKQAAGRIHSDIEHGFVRAQVVNIDDLIELKSFHAAREKALLRTEGKDYVVQDGDVINFMHTG